MQQNFVYGLNLAYQILLSTLMAPVFISQYQVMHKKVLWMPVQSTHALERDSTSIFYKSQQMVIRLIKI